MASFLYSSIIEQIVMIINLLIFKFILGITN